MASVTVAAAYVCLVWSTVVFLVQFVGINRLFRNFSSPPKPPVSPTLEPEHVPHVTAIRPVKGLEPHLYECIASSFHQDYPRDKLTVYLCVAEACDPAYPVLKQLVEDFPECDARVFVESEDPLLYGAEGHVDNLGPNPKIRNISRAYKEAKGDLIWVIDCNVWIPRATTGHMVDKLVGLGRNGQATQPYKFVHQVPLVVDAAGVACRGDAQPLLGEDSSPTDSALMTPANQSRLARIRSTGGGRLDEMFMATTHAKFYSAINTVGIAPCIVGKSNMFRKSHIETLTDPARNPGLPGREGHPRGIDYFSDYICEDHLIGDLLWRARIAGLGNHGLVLGDLAIQPMDGMSVDAYVARRVRWLRARKWTVIAATLVEPGVESLLCCAYFAFALTTIPWFHDALGVPQTWAATLAVWLTSVGLWMLADRVVFNRLHACGSVGVDADTPFFARGTSRPGGVRARPFREWLAAWVGRELLAMPIWTWAVLLGTTVNWRGRTFTVRMDMSVAEKGGGGGSRRVTPEIEHGRATTKNRLD